MTKKHESSVVLLSVEASWGSLQSPWIPQGSRFPHSRQKKVSILKPSEPLYPSHSRMLGQHSCWLCISFQTAQTNLLAIFERRIIAIGLASYDVIVTVFFPSTKEKNKEMV